MHFPYLFNKKYILVEKYIMHFPCLFNRIASEDINTNPVLLLTKRQSIKERAPFFEERGRNECL